MKRFILFAFVLVLGCYGQNCTKGLKKSNGHCCKLDHYYSTRYNECRYCKCNEFGAKGGKKGECRENGDCYCYGNYTDGECGSCVTGLKNSNGRCCKPVHYYNTRLNKCRYCKCDKYGAKGGEKGECDEKGKCYCYDEYTDGACRSCVKGGKRLDNGRCDDGCPSGEKRSNGHCCKLDHYFSKRTNKCRYCKCNEFGAKGGKKGRCNDNGDCYCYPNYRDGECGSCASNTKRSNSRCCKKDEYYSTRFNKCRYCRCNRYGAKGGEKGECDENGDCYCYDDYTDGECSSCVKGGTRLKNGRCDDGCPSGQKRSNGRCCKLDHYYNTRLSKCRYCKCNVLGAKGGKKGRCRDNGNCYCYPHYSDGACRSCASNAKRSNGRCCLKDYYYSTRFNKCRYCKCNKFGAKGGEKGECDEKGKCYCYDEYTNGECSHCVPGGIRLDNGRCDDRCPSGQKRSNGHCCRLDHYNYGRTKNCRPCRCNKYGAKGGEKGRCADENGKCYCYGHYDGDECQKCKSNAKRSNGRCCLKAHYFNTGPGKCRACRCEAPGSKGGKKGECTYYGWCHCYPGYKGSECQDCKPGYKWSNGHCCKKDYYYATWDYKCRFCGCDDNGAKGGKNGGCDDKGWCHCKKGYIDAYCSTCTMGSGNKCCKTDEYLNKKKCYYCGCHSYGAKGGSKGKCDDSTGKCDCKRSWSGTKCNH